MLLTLTASETLKFAALAGARMGTGYSCIECGNYGADRHTLVCDQCFVKLPPFFRLQAERRAIDAALLRQSLMGEGMAVRWTESQFQDHMRRASAPAPRETRKHRELPVEVNDPRTLVFELPLTPMRNGLDRMHFRAKRRLHDSIAEAFRLQLLKVGGAVPFGKAKIEIVRMSSVEPDPDGLVGSVKPILDAMQVASKRHPYGAGLIENDSPGCITLSVRWQRSAPKAGKVIVLVTPA